MSKTVSWCSEHGNEDAILCCPGCLADYKAALAGIEGRPEDVRAVILAAHTLCKYPCQEADDALVRSLSKIKIEE